MWVGNKQPPPQVGLPEGARSRVSRASHLLLRTQRLPAQRRWLSRTEMGGWRTESGSACRSRGMVPGRSLLECDVPAQPREKGPGARVKVWAALCLRVGQPHPRCSTASSRIGFWPWGRCSLPQTLPSNPGTVRLG